LGCIVTYKMPGVDLDAIVSVGGVAVNFTISVASSVVTIS
jgi:hypothetical protein